MRVTLGTMTIVALVAASGALLPAAAGDHCSTKITMYGRSALTPTPPPPYTTVNQGVCPKVEPGFDHSLPPTTDQILVRVNGDFGSRIPTLRLDLDGVGFEDATFTLYRTANMNGGFTYQLPQWLTIPDARGTGAIKATAYYPDGPMNATYVLGTRVPLPTVDQGLLFRG